MPFGVPVSTVVHGKQTFTTSQTFRVPTKVTTLLKVVVANSGGFSGTSGLNAAGGGGGGGEACYVQNVAVTPGMALTITCNSTPTATGTVSLNHPTLGTLSAAAGGDGANGSGGVAGAGGAGGGTGGGAGGAGGNTDQNGTNGTAAGATGSDSATWSGYTISRYYGGGGGGGAADSTFLTGGFFSGGSGANNSDGDAGDFGVSSNAALGHGGGGGGQLTITGVAGPHSGNFDLRGATQAGVATTAATPPQGTTGWIYIEW